MTECRDCIQTKEALARMVAAIARGDMNAARVEQELVQSLVIKKINEMNPFNRGKA